MSCRIIPLPKRAHDLSLQIFGKLVVIAPAELDKRRSAWWLCVCHCGNVVVRKGQDIKKPGVHSCGCISTRAKHGATGSKEFKAWIDMIRRCTIDANKRFPAYGGRGITVCESWLTSFETFYQDMGPCPDGYSLDRVDNNGNYCPDNCRWASKHEQSNNKRTNKTITYKGETRTIAQWARELNIGPETLSYRIMRWRPIERAFETPVQKHTRSSSAP